MIQIVCGEKGKGKTKIMLEKANEAVKTSTGSIAYLDKTLKHSYELDNDIRLIDVTEYPVSNFDGLLGFVSGLLAGNHDLEVVFFDSFLKLAAVTEDTLDDAVKKLEALSNDVTFILSISLDESNIPDEIKSNIVSSC